MTICFTGFRPNKLPGGYDYSSPENIQLKRELYRVISEIIQPHKEIHFICGGALGVDQIAFAIVRYIQYKDISKNITIELAMPFKNMDLKWNNEARMVHIYQISQADKVTIVSEGDYAPWKMQIRNQYMVDNSDLVIGVWSNSSPGGTKNCIDYAKTKGKKIVIIDPINLQKGY